MKALIEGMILVCYICDFDSHNLEEHRKEAPREELEESESFLLCDTVYSVRLQKELETTSHVFVKSDDIDEFRHLQK